MDFAWFNSHPNVVKYGLSIATFIAGFLVSRFTLSKKDRLDVGQKQFENSKALMESQQACFMEFANALKKYANKKGKPDLNDFAKIATTGETYFYQQKVTCDAILGGTVDRQSRDNTLVPMIVETVQKSLPAYYATLQGIAAKNEFDYEGELKRENYESLYRVVEKYGKLPSQVERQLAGSSKDTPEAPKA